MPPHLDFDQIMASGGDLADPHIPTLIIRMALATVLGTFVAMRIWRVLLNIGLPSPQNVQAQTLMAAAGSVMVIVLGDSPARAFGLVGLGAFVRFRAGLSDPRDAVVTFVAIGIGMSCGLGLLAMAGVFAALVSVLLFIFDITDGRLPRRTLVTINAEDPMFVMQRVMELFPHSRVIEVSNNAIELGKESGRVVLEISLRGKQDASSFRAYLEQSEVIGVRRVAFATD